MGHGECKESLRYLCKKQRIFQRPMGTCQKDKGTKLKGLQLSKFESIWKLVYKKTIKKIITHWLS